MGFVNLLKQSDTHLRHISFVSSADFVNSSKNDFIVEEEDSNLTNIEEDSSLTILFYIGVFIVFLVISALIMHIKRKKEKHDKVCKIQEQRKTIKKEKIRRSGNRHPVKDTKLKETKKVRSKSVRELVSMRKKTNPVKDTKLKETKKVKDTKLKETKNVRKKSVRELVSMRKKTMEPKNNSGT